MSGEETHWGVSPAHGGLTQHKGRADTCGFPNCADANFPPRDKHGRFLPYAKVIRGRVAAALGVTE